MVQARIVNDTTTIDVRGEQTETNVAVKSESTQKSVKIVGVMNHNELRGRNDPDQHPIDSITGLAETLSEISDKNFVFEQSIASDTWVIEHNLNKRASCVAVDSAGEVQIPDKIKYISDNEIIATFLAPFAGKAYLN